MNISTCVLAICTALTLSTPDAAAPACISVEPTVIMQTDEGHKVITVEEYVTGVVAHEMPYTFETEALKAQAVAARTYLYYCLENNSHPHNGADVCDDFTHCCGFITEEQLAMRFGKLYAQEAFEKVSEAVSATAGEVLFYEGKPILSVWHSSSHGFTEDSGEVFLQSLPYLQAVKSPENAETTVVSYTLTEVKALLRGAGFKYNASRLIKLHSTLSGRCKRITIGNASLSGKAARELFCLKSTDFTAEFHNGRLYFTVRGYGHGVGMSQYGAETLAKSGSGYREILSHYYRGSALETFTDKNQTNKKEA